jgi:hypothetical protein
MKMSDCKDCEGSCGSCETGEMLEDLKKMKLALDTINKNREQGLKTLEDKVQRLMESEVLNVDKMGGNADLVATLRDLAMATNSTFQTVEAENHLVDMVISDLIQVTSKLDAINQNLFVTGSHLQVLLQVLQSKKLITEEELRATWMQMQSQIKLQQEIPE